LRGSLLEHRPKPTPRTFGRNRRRTAQLRQVNLNLQQEINDRMQAEDALRRNEEQLRLITNALPVLIAYVDAKQRYRFNNQAYKDWLGCSPENIYGQHLKQVWGKECYERMGSSVKAALSGQAVTYENEICLVDGSIRSVSVTYIPHIDNTRGKIKGFFALTSDISDRKAIERMKDEFISVVSHELRTPLTSIHSALKILATGRLGSLSPGGQQMLEIADENTDRLVRLVNNVLDLQRIESGEVKMDKQACNTADLMIKATEAMQAMAQQHDIILSTEPISIPLWVDPDYIVQALTNLLSNAIKFSTPGGTVWLSVEKGQEIRFQVKDQGQGIPADKLESIFERFHQVDSSDSRKKGGTGLGLTICRKIIEQRLRAAESTTPILLLTGQNTSVAKIMGLNAGADDYVVKPFDEAELIVRIRALLRRSSTNPLPVLSWSELWLNFSTCEVTYAGKPLTLTAKEYALLELLLRESQHVFSNEEILESLWSSEEFPVDATVRSHIRRLRHKLTVVGAPPDLIATAHGRGYYLKPLFPEVSSLVPERKDCTSASGGWGNMSNEGDRQNQQTQYLEFLNQTWATTQEKCLQQVRELQEAIAFAFA
jgi:PAS domain S-box-containing protein